MASPALAVDPATGGLPANLTTEGVPTRPFPRRYLFPRPWPRSALSGFAGGKAGISAALTKNAKQSSSYR
ncbi:hypothetical protein HNR29_003313 [Rhizobium leguminosarum]|jgi:hypothetical protein|nr:hypothetical protein [Rhizobium leguminosarum]